MLSISYTHTRSQRTVDTTKNVAEIRNDDKQTDDTKIISQKLVSNNY